MLMLSKPSKLLPNNHIIPAHWRNSPARLGALLGLLTALLNTAPALANDRLFEITVPIANQERSELNRTLPAAFSQLLQKLTANPEVISQPWANLAVGQAERYVSSFRYQQPAETIEVPKEPLLRLIAQFDSDAVTKLLEDSATPYWSNIRPTLVLWLLLDEGRKRQIINGEAEIARIIATTADQLGLQIILPLMDLQEQSLVTTSHLWLQDTQLLQQSSSRYDSQIFAVARLQQHSDGKLSGDWLLSINGDQQQWVHPKANVDDHFALAFAAIREPLFTRYSHSPLAIHSTSDLLVTRVTDFNSFREIRDYLSDLQGVTQVIPLQVAPGNVLFRLQHSGEWNELIRLFERGDRLLPVGSHELAAPGSNPLPRYQLIN